MRGLAPADKAREAPVLNAITVDVEDWLQSTVDSRLPLTDHFRANTQKVLAAFAARNTHATFFVLGLAAEQDPGLVREIQAAGHEVQSHGYGHQLVHELTPAQFRADLERSKKLLEDLTGQEIYGYRAPAFTITKQTLWALDVLVETGYRYDSSVFPLHTARYGIDGAPRFPHVLTTSAGQEIRELPVASYEFAGRRFPTGGGGYFRLLPYFILRRGVRQLNARGHSATIYMHPYEYNPAEFEQLDQQISWRMRLHQGLWRRRFPGRVDRFLTEFRFGTVRDVIAATTYWPRFTHAGPQLAIHLPTGTIHAKQPVLPAARREEIPMATPYWKNRLATVANTDELLALFHLEYGDKYPWFNKAYWQWRYQSQTGFAADVMVSEFEGRLIGVLPQTLFDFQWGTQRFRGAMIYGLITHPDHRRKGVFRSLIGSCNELAVQQGANFSMGIPNDPSLPGYATFGGWEYLGLIHTHLRILNLPKLLSAKAGKFLGYLLGSVPQLYFGRRRPPLAGPCADCELSRSAPDELTDVFDEFARDCGTLMIRRTAPFWNWRYADKPSAPYHMLIARQGGRVTGAVLTSVREHAGIQVGLVADLVCRGGVTGMRQLLRHAEDDMRARGVEVLTCWATTPLLKRALDEERYWHPKPQRLGKNFHYIWRPTGVPGLPRSPGKLEDWHLSFSDSDNA